MVRFKSQVAALTALAGLAAAMSGPAVAASCPMIEVAPVAQPSDAGARVFAGPDGRSIAVSSPLVSSHDIIGAGVSAAEGQTGLNVRVSGEAKERVRSYTASHVGGSLAFIVDGRPQMVLRILDPIARDEFWLSPMDEASAKRMASALRDCAPKAGR